MLYEVITAPQGYIIRGKVPAEIFTILNPCPEQLGRYMGENRLVQLEVRIVSGDNVEIEKIDGNTYSPECKSGGY